MGLEFCHALELPAKMQYDGSFYVTIQNTLYRYFGMPGPGAFITLGAIASATVLSLLVRKRRSVFYWTLVGTVCLVIAFPGVFFLFIEPVNVVIERATPESVPANWMQLRNQWEYAHAANFVLSLAGFSALLISVLVDIPVNHSRDRAKRQYIALESRTER